MSLGATYMTLIMVSGFSTLTGSLPVFFHRYIGERGRAFWESFGGGVMVSASVFSLFLPAFRMSESFWPILEGAAAGVAFIAVSAFVVKKLTQNIARQRAFLFVFVMALHNIPEGLSVGVDVAALGFPEALPLCVAIFIQNIPEGLVSSLSFVLAGFSLPTAILANALTAMIETLSAFAGHEFVKVTSLKLPLLLSFAGASMMTVVGNEIKDRITDEEDFSRSGFALGLTVCALLDLFL